MFFETVHGRSSVVSVPLGEVGRIISPLSLVRSKHSCYSNRQLFSPPYFFCPAQLTRFCRPVQLFSCYSCSYNWELFQHSVGRIRMINLPAELGWVSKNLPLSPQAAPSGLGQVFTDPPSLCWQVHHKPFPNHNHNAGPGHRSPDLHIVEKRLCPLKSGFNKKIFITFPIYRTNS